MKYLSLFSGIGGFELGIQKAYEDKLCGEKQQERLSGVQQGRDSSSIASEDRHPQAIGYSEIDKYAIQVYNKHFNHKNYGDCTKINATELPDFDLLVGGFPCQAFSIAGKRRGFDDTRGTLFFDIARILKEKHPRNFILENVKGLLSHDNGRTFKTIISTLVELGYGVEWQVLNAKNFGVPQNRERVFIVGHLGGFSGRKVFPITSDTGEITESVKRKRITTGRTRNFGSSGQLHQPDEICSTMTQSMGTGGNNVPCIIGFKSPLKETDIASTLMARDYKGIGNQGTNAVINETRIRRLTPKECERLMSYPDDWTLEGTEGKISDTQRYKMCGNGIVSNVVAEVVRPLISKL